MDDYITINKYKRFERFVSYSNTSILKFDIPTQYLGQKFYLQTRRVGTIPDFEETEAVSEYHWPTFITAGDISRDGKMIMLRGYRS